MERSRILLLVASVLVAALLIIYGWHFAFGARTPSAEQLADAALNAGTAEEQEAAAGKLASLGQPAQPEMVRVLNASKTPGVRAALISELTTEWCYDCMPAFLEALDDESLAVRIRAEAAMQRLMQFEVGYHAQDPPEQRREAVKAYRQTWEKVQKLPRMKAFREQLKEKAS
jgi:hypothetical protein